MLHSPFKLQYIQTLYVQILFKTQTLLLSAPGTRSQQGYHTNSVCYKSVSNFNKNVWHHSDRLPVAEAPPRVCIFVRSIKGIYSILMYNICIYIRTRRHTHKHIFTHTHINTHARTIFQKIPLHSSTINKCAFTFCE